MKFLTAPVPRLLLMATILLALGALVVLDPESTGSAPEIERTPATIALPAGGLLLAFGLWTIAAGTIRSWRAPALWAAGLGMIGLVAGAVLELVRRPEWDTTLVATAIVAGVVGIWNPIAGVVHGRTTGRDAREEEAGEEEA